MAIKVFLKEVIKSLKKTEDVPTITSFGVLLSFLVLIVMTTLSEAMHSAYCFLTRKTVVDKNYAPLRSGFRNLWDKQMNRLRGVFSRPIDSTPGAWIRVHRRQRNVHGKWTVAPETTDALNFGSYNYLGFAESNGVATDHVLETLSRGISMCSPVRECGYSEAHIALEQDIADYLGKDAAICFGMGFATNSTVINALVGKGDLIISDSLNHTSIVVGARVSGATIKPFEHSNYDQLESILRESIVYGDPRTRRPYGKILVIVEGIYSMEGEMVNLPRVLEIKKKYPFYLYVDEAHSIGSTGPRGAGVVDYYGIDPKEVDILMGTFSKSYGAAGGYIASTKEVIAHLRSKSLSTTYAPPLTIGAVTQIHSALKLVRDTDEGKARLLAIRENSIYMRKRLIEMGFTIYGNYDSPVVPLLVYLPTKVQTMSEYLLDKNVAVVVVGYPAVPVNGARIRLCLSSSHTKKDIDYCLTHLDVIGDMLKIKYSKGQ